MIKNYQTIIDPGKGNCVAACISSMFNLTIDEVPKFLPDENQFTEIISFMELKGYEYVGCLHNQKFQTFYWTNFENCFKPIITCKSQSLNKINLKKLSDVDGVYLATVLSPKYYSYRKNTEAFHAVLIDKDFNIIHDPNPNYKGILKYPLADILGYNGIIRVDGFKKMRIK